jgi:hypothetical protein
LLYRHDTWHRGTPLKRQAEGGPGIVRFAQNLTFRKRSSEVSEKMVKCCVVKLKTIYSNLKTSDILQWITNCCTGWAWAAYNQDKRFERAIAGCSVEQRAVLGIPLPGEAYWTRHTVAAVKARYGVYGFDATPYEAALTDGGGGGEEPV